ncbi:MAG: hypothetical protein ACXWC7_17770, partial [Chitinophagaceae bacterium]
MKSCLKLTVRKISVFILFILALTLHSGCGEAVTQPAKIETFAAFGKAPEPVLPETNDAATILSRPEVPILCYHQVRDYRPSDSKTAKDYIVPVDVFRDQMKLLADSGYTAILPGQLHEYLVTGKVLPAKPVLITFDDTRLDQFTAALPELNKFGFKGAFFIMTVALGKPG